METGDIKSGWHGYLRKPGRGAVLFFAFLVALIVGGRTFLPGKVLLPYDPQLHRPFADALTHAEKRERLSVGAPYLGDHLLQFLAFDRFTANQLGKGKLPRWNPGPFAGTYHPAQGTSQVYYPPCLLLALGPPLDMVHLIFILHLAVGALTIFCWLTRLKLHRMAVIGAAMLWLLSGWAWTNTHHPMIYYAGAWVFLGLLGIEKLKARPWCPGGILALFGASALTLLAGFPQISMMAMAMLGLYAAMLSIMTWRESGLRAVGTFILPTGLATLAGLFTAMPHLLAMAEQAALTSRPPLTAATMQEHALTLPQLLGFLMPEFFSPLRGTPYDSLSEWHSTYPMLALVRKPAHVLGGFNAKETWLYLGVFPLLLTAAALPLWRRPRVAFFWLLSGIVLLISLGTPLIIDLHAMLPGGAMGDAKRLLYLIAPAGVVLAAFGLDRIIRAGKPGRILLAGAVTLAIPGLAALACGLLLADQTILQYTLDRITPIFADQLQAYPKPWWKVLLANQPEEVKLFNLALIRTALIRFGLLAVTSALALWWCRTRRPGALKYGLLLGLTLSAADLGYTAWRMTTPIPDSQIKLTEKWTALFPNAPKPGPLAPDRLIRLEASAKRGNHPGLLTPNLANLIGWEDIQGYTPLMPKRLCDLFKGLDPKINLGGAAIHSLKNPAHLEAPFIAWLRPRLLLTDIPLDRPQWRPCGQTSANTYLYANTKMHPYGMTIPAWQVITDPIQRVKALTTPTFNPRQQAIVETAPPGAMPAIPKVAKAVQLISRCPGTITVKAEGPGLVVLSTGWRPGWTVTGNGPRRPAMPVNHAFLGTWLPSKGTHELTFHYARGAYWQILPYILCGLALLAIALFLTRRPGRTSAPTLLPDGATDSNS